ncbi:MULTISPECIES: HetP family heterocyst commitment protein [Planktothricoides]|uniref:HetP family heterocyst commitment protein n=2 Tax=Planktothricoides raciborskii TaxID=132608 RepID=A0AAU8JB02_9CYAN|nr:MULTISPECIES: HetP family heterocyst commitment protein [Planktothricoides]KOR38609.1 hypothetical protein AM228_01205 [Planktothricoides sp. SR001]MBD2546659.1 HetP family heterocyst commitment protein [Planktothricoides raciborskii FACHB-1370]MBD2585160.1 HetP family heterocyst commitment protein [Planktothricoides raciborskii FACHB-1261]
MHYEISYPESKLDKVMTLDQFEQVVEAILAGKYSWACVLILRFGGYNPLHYIPYRTYNRLLKEHQTTTKAKGNRPNHINPTQTLDEQRSQSLTKNEIRKAYGTKIKEQLLDSVRIGDSLTR